MGILNARPKLEPGEALAWKSAANHVAGSIYTLWGMKTASGGQLVLTDSRSSSSTSSRRNWATWAR